jgi:hypothetical protein
MSESDTHPQIKNTAQKIYTNENRKAHKNRQDNRNGAFIQGINNVEDTSFDDSSENSTQQHDYRYSILTQE